MYSGVYVMLLALFYLSQQVDGSCVACAYKTSKEQCNDPISASYDYVCLSTSIDMSLCRRYGGGYSVYCGSSYCHRRSTACKAGSIHHAYPAAWLLAVFLAIVTAK